MMEKRKGVKKNIKMRNRKRWKRKKKFIIKEKEGKENGTGDWSLNVWFSEFFILSGNLRICIPTNTPDLP